MEFSKFTNGQVHCAREATQMTQSSSIYPCKRSLWRSRPYFKVRQSETLVIPTNVLKNETQQWMEELYPLFKFLEGTMMTMTTTTKTKGLAVCCFRKKKRIQLNISSVRTRVRDNDNNTTIYQSSVSLEKTTTAACIRSKSLTWNIRNIFSTYVHTIHVILCTTFVSIWIMFTLQANDGIVFLSRHLHQLNFFVLKI